MKTVVILGAGMMGQAARNLLNLNSMELVAVGDNNEKKWDYDAEVQILPVEEALQAEPDLVLVCVLDDERAGQLSAQARRAGYHGSIMTLADVYNLFDVRGATFRRMADRIEARGVPGAMAELGTYRGDFAWQMNERFPDRKLYLFDTFGGFDRRDVETEKQISARSERKRDFSATSAADVLARMPYERSVIIRQGYFPETTNGLEDVRYALVSLDADLYAPMLAGLEYFVPRMSPGGAIFLHDYNSLQFDGVLLAVQAYEEAHGPLTMLPLSDLHGTAVLLFPEGGDRP